MEEPGTNVIPFSGGLLPRVGPDAPTTSTRAGIYALHGGSMIVLHDLDLAVPARAVLMRGDLRIVAGINPDGSFAIRVLDEGTQVLLVTQQAGRVLHVRRQRPFSADAVDGESIISERELQTLTARWGRTR